MRMPEWDDKVGQHLAHIRLDAGWVDYYARKIGEHVRKLPLKPNFETEAESKLTDAIQGLETALAGMREMREVYRGLQVEKH